MERLLGEIVENAAVLSKESLTRQQVHDEVPDVFADGEADDDANLGTSPLQRAKTVLRT